MKSIKIYCTILTILSSFLLVSFASNYSSNEYICITIKGRAIDYWSRIALKKQDIYIYDEESRFIGEFELYFNQTTNKKGEFIITVCLKKPINKIWITTKHHAEIELQTKTEFKNLDTIDLGDIYFVSYDNEFKITEKYNIPKNYKKKRLKSKYQAVPIKKIKTEFNDNKLTNLRLKSIDSSEVMTRINFGNDKKDKTTIRGRIIFEEKTITFTKNVDKNIIRKL